MSYNVPRVPLHLQNNELSKAASKISPSYESARKNEIFKPEYKEMDDRPTTHAMATIRRYTNGQLDFEWASSTIISAVHKAEQGHNLTPVEEALLTVVFPVKFPMVEPQMAEIRTQLSRSEKQFLKKLVDGKLKEELNYNAGRGGGSVPGRTRTLNGAD